LDSARTAIRRRHHHTRRRQRHRVGSGCMAAAGARLFPALGRRVDAHRPRSRHRRHDTALAPPGKMTETAVASNPPAKGPRERLLSPCADVRRGESASALLLTLLMFLLLTSYYMLKTAREVFILSEGGAEVKSYSSAGQAVLLLFLVPAYGAFASRVSRVQLVTWVSLFFASNILLFVLAAAAQIGIGVPFFLWLAVYNVMVVAQFWAFANDVYTPEQGKRLFPLIGVGSSLGALAGSLRAGHLMETQGPVRLLVGGGAILVICVGLARLIDRSSRRAASTRQ